MYLYRCSQYETSDFWQGLLESAGDGAEAGKVTPATALPLSKPFTYHKDSRYRVELQ